MFSTLNQDSPKYLGDFTPKLFLHQQTSVHAMMNLEDSMSKNIEKDDRETSFGTQMGILADKPGAGKSYMILALIASRPTLDNNPTWERHDGSSTGRVYKKSYVKFTKVIPTNLLIIPNALVDQWTHYCKTSITELSVFTPPKIFRQHDIDAIVRGDYNIAVVTGYQYAKIRTKAAENIMKIKFQRVIVDEADSIVVTNCILPPACFTWFVTATPRSVLCGCCTSSKLNTFFKNDDLNLNEDLVVKNVHQFVDQSLNLPMYTTRTLMAFSAINEISDIPKNIKEALNACDVSTAVSLLGISTVNNEDGIIPALIEKNNMIISNLAASIANTPGELVTQIVNKIKGLKEKNERLLKNATIIVEQDVCPITMEPFEHKAVAPCTHAFELCAIEEALKKGERCPMCRAPLTLSQLIVTSTNFGGCGPSTSSEANVVKKSKNSILVDELKKLDGESKVLVFSSFEMKSTIKALTDANIPFIVPDGKVGQISKKIREFSNNGGVMLLNTNHFGAGLNLQMATHIFTLHDMSIDRYNQLIGRAHRIGRNFPLEVVNIRFEHECVVKE